jgi:hypothetical protein
MRVFASVVLAAAVAMSSSLMAQWPTFKTPNVPRNADGTVNMAAPAPKTADGHPDFSGVWAAAGGGGGGGRGGGRAAAPGGAPPAAGAPAGAPAGAAAGAPGRGNAGAQAGGRGGAGRGAGGPGGGAPGGGGRGRGNQGPAFSEGPPVAAFFNVGQNLEGGMAPMTPWAAELKAKRLADNAKDNPDAHCLPIGFTQFHTHPQPRKILQTPSEVAIIYESNYGLREIYLDGRKAPPTDDQDVAPWWYGYTVGHWEGDTLVATTTHIRDGMWLDVNGTPLTDQATVVERFRRPVFGNLEIDITFTDPKAFTKPFTVRVNQRLMVDTDLIEFICNENEQSSKHYEK